MTAPYYQDESTALYLGDFEEVLPTLGVKADAILTVLAGVGRQSRSVPRFPVRSHPRTCGGPGA